MKKIYVFAFVLLAAVCTAFGQPCITNSPAYIAGEEFNLCGGKTVTYNCTPVEGATGYTWEVPAGFTIISGQGTSTVTIKTAAIFYTAEIKVSAVFPCGNSIQTKKTLNAIPRNYNDELNGPYQILRGSTNNYSLPSIPGMKYSWVADGSSVVGGWNTNSVSIKVGPTVRYGQVQATVSNSCGGTVSWKYFSVLEAENCPTLQVNYTQTNPDRCPGSTNGSAELIVTGGNPPYTYRWDGPNGFTSTSKSVSGLGEGSYWAYVTDSKGCTSETYLYIGDMYPQTMPPYPIEGPVDNLCGVKTVSYTATETPGASAYNWTIPAGFTLVSGQGTRTITIKTPSSFDTANLKVTAVLPCGNLEPIWLELHGTPPNLETQISGPDQVLVGSVNTYSLPAVPGASYSWVADGGNVVSGWGSNSVGVKAGIINGYVRATVKNACGTSPVSVKWFTIRTGESCSAPNVYGVVRHPERCLGSKTGEVRLDVRNGIGPFTYKWTGPNGFTRTVKDISGIEAGLYKVRVDAPGGCYVEETFRVGPPDQNLDFPYPIMGPKEDLCGGKTVTYTCVAMEEALSFNWVIPEGFTLISGQGTYSITLKTPASFTTALLQVSALLPCGPTGLRSVELKGALGDMSSSIIGPSEVVAGSTNTYTLPSMPGVSYSWVADGGSVVGGWNTNSVSIRAGTISGYVKVTLKNSCGTAPLARKYFTVSPASSVASASNLVDVPAAAAGRFTVNPNPVYDRATVQFDSENNERYQLRVVDIYGKVLQVKTGVAVKGNNIVKLDVGGYAQGMYIVNLITRNKARTMKLLKR